MMGRALSLAAAGVLGCLVASPSQAQQNLDAGKSAAQIFNGNCGACHRSARGLLKTVSPSSLHDFLREHYTTGDAMAQSLTAYLTSNRAGAADRDAPSGPKGARQQDRANIRPDAPIGNLPEGSEQTKPDGKPARAAASKPDEPGANPADAGKRRQRRSADMPEQATGEPDAAAQPGAKPRQARRGKRGEPAVTVTQPPQDAAPKAEAVAPKDGSTPKDTERAIDARVPVPEPVVLPPPTAADVKPAEVKPAEAKPAETRPEAPAATADRPVAEKPAEAAHAGTDDPATPDGAPVPPISR